MLPPNGFLGYHPRGYQPKPDPVEPIPETRLRQARHIGATHISLDGSRIFVKRFNSWLQADWLGLEWGGWWECGELPKEIVTL